MKNIDIKLLNIGVLLAAAAFFGMGVRYDLSDEIRSPVSSKHGGWGSCASPRSRPPEWPSDIPDPTRPRPKED